MIFLYSDVLFAAGGIESYLHALARHLHREGIRARVVVAELERCPLLDELIGEKLQVYRQYRLPGDRWLVRQRVMMAWLVCHLRPGDWVFCVRQPMPSLYLWLVRIVHGRGGRIAASWIFAPEFLQSPDRHFCRAVAETDAVISVSRSTVPQYKKVYHYDGHVHVVPYHNNALFDAPVPLPQGPPWRIGFMGRLERRQKNLDRLISAFGKLVQRRLDVELHFHGRGPDQSALEQIAFEAGLGGRVVFHGPYDHRRDLPSIMARCHFFVYPSRFEGGPCLSLLEIMQAGRFCVASRVGGIPDLYENHPEAGMLVDGHDAGELCRALQEAFERVINGKVDPQKVRDRYFDGFDMFSAHRAWMNALGFDKVSG